MSVHVIDANKIKTIDELHAVFYNEFKFPSYYGNNMNAWIDCMSDLDEPVLIYIENVAVIKGTEVYDALIECSAFVNYRMMDNGKPIITLAFWDQDHIAKANSKNGKIV